VRLLAAGKGRFGATGSHSRRVVLPNLFDWVYENAAGRVTLKWMRWLRKTEEPEIRLAQQEEAEQITSCLALAFEAFRSQYTSEAFKDTVLSPEAVRTRMGSMRVYVAVAGETMVVGTLAAAASGEEGHLRGIAVRPEWQGRGIAEQLLTRAESDLKAAGCRRVTLDTTLPLQRATRFYARSGFVRSGQVVDFFGMPLHEFVKQLSSEE
jgi:ribosomal protein S18 acetylase RimI-like enzyme